MTDETELWLRPQAPGGKPPARWDRSIPAAPTPPAALPPPPPPTTPPPTVPPPVHAGHPHPGQPPPPVSYPPMPPSGYVPASNGQATAGLILGIAGVTVVVLGMGVFFFVSLPCSILAWVFGANTKHRLERGEMLEGRTQAESAYVLGIIGVVLGVVGLIAWIVLIALGAIVDSSGNQDALSSAASAASALAALLG